MKKTVFLVAIEFLILLLSTDYLNKVSDAQYSKLTILAHSIGISFCTAVIIEIDKRMGGTRVIAELLINILIIFIFYLSLSSLGLLPMPVGQALLTSVIMALLIGGILKCSVFLKELVNQIDERDDF